MQDYVIMKLSINLSGSDMNDYHRHPPFSSLRYHGNIADVAVADVIAIAVAVASVAVDIAVAAEFHCCEHDVLIVAYMLGGRVGLIGHPCKTICAVPLSLSLSLSRALSPRVPRSR